MNIKSVFSLLLVLCLAACGGGGGGSSASSGSSSSGSGSSGSTTTTVNNVASIVVDAGPTGKQSNMPFVSVTICVPGSTTNCQTIDHIQVDTGSVGLRVIAGVLNSSMRAGLPIQTDASSRPIGECYQYVDGYVWGSVRKADFTIAGETSAAMPIQVIGDDLYGGFAPAPSLCSSGGGTAENTVSAFGANGIIGIGFTATDCGSACAAGQTGSSGYPYYACTGTSSTATCVQTAQGASSSAPNQQLPNPVSTFATDNNGSLITLPSVAATGAASATGSLIFGIGTQSNNALGSAKVYTISSSTGLFTTVYKSSTLPYSYIDSGTSVLAFNDASISQCTGTGWTGYGFYCPASTLSLTATNVGTNSASGSVAFNVANAQGLNYAYAALPALAVTANAGALSSNSFAWGLPFFYGRTVFTAISGASTPGGTGPYFAY